MGDNGAKRIVSDPAILGGKPVIKGTRIAVYLILDLLSEGYSFDDILAIYPHLTLEDIKACIQYAAKGALSIVSDTGTRTFRDAF